MLVNVADPAGEQLGLALTAGPVALFHLSVPNDSALCGIAVYSQAIHVGGVSPFALSNAYDMTIGSP